MSFRKELKNLKNGRMSDKKDFFKKNVGLPLRDIDNDDNNENDCY